MWSDPIENALSQARVILDEVQRGTIQPDATSVSSVIGTLDRALRARRFEKDLDRLVTPLDPV